MHYLSIIYNSVWYYCNLCIRHHWPPMRRLIFAFLCMYVLYVSKVVDRRLHDQNSPPWSISTVKVFLPYERPTNVVPAFYFLRLYKTLLFLCEWPNLRLHCTTVQLRAVKVSAIKKTPSVPPTRVIHHYRFISLK